jgi:hypothetical protein
MDIGSATLMARVRSCGGQESRCEKWVETACWMERSYVFCGG